MYFPSKTWDLLVIPAGMENTHKSQEFANPDIFGKALSVFDPICLIVAGNNDMH